MSEIQAEAGELEEVEHVAAWVLRQNPAYSIDEYIGNLSFSDSSEITWFADGLRLTGLPQ